MLRVLNRAAAARGCLSTLSTVSHRRFLAFKPLHRGLSSSTVPPPPPQQPQTPSSASSAPQQTSSSSSGDKEKKEEEEEQEELTFEEKARRLSMLVILGVLFGTPIQMYFAKDEDGNPVYTKEKLRSGIEDFRESKDDGLTYAWKLLSKTRDVDNAARIAIEEKKLAKLKAAAAKPTPSNSTSSPAPAAPVVQTSTVAPIAVATAVTAASSSSSSTQPPATPAAPSATSADEIDWRKTPVDFPPDEDQAFSAAVSTVKLSEHISPMVAIEIAEKIYRRDENVLLQIYAPWCGACKMLTPVVQTVSKVLHEIEQEPTAEGQKPVQHISVYAMDGDANNLPGFLTKEESRALPLVKFFPKCGSQKNPDTNERNSPACQSQLYEFKPNTKNILEFVVAGLNAQPNIEQSNRKVSMDKALSIAAGLEEETQVKVLKALEVRFAADSASTPSLKVHEIAPCGDKLHRIMQNFMLSSYRSPGFLRSEKEEDERGLEMFGEYRTCTEKEEKNLEEFWQQVKKQAEDALEGIDNKKKQSAETAVVEKKADIDSTSSSNEDEKDKKKQN